MTGDFPPMGPYGPYDYYWMAYPWGNPPSFHPTTPIVDEADIALARSFLDKADEDWTFIDPEDVKRLARAVIEKAT